MEPHFKKRPAKSRTSVILGTGLVLIAVFLLIVLLFFLFSAMAPAFVGECVAVVDINRPLSIDGAPATIMSEGYMGSEELAQVVEDLNERPDIGAVVFVFNSPGGSVVATHEIYEAVKALDKPKVSYFREVAASGAYYIASGTDYIITDPVALTGSIGVVATVTEMSGLMEKLGVNVTSIASGKHKDIGSPFKNMTEEERQIFQGVVDEIYDEFRNVVLVNRHGKLDMDRFGEIEDGRVLTGRQALEVGLVDQTGNKKDAIIKAAQLAGMNVTSVDEVKVCHISTSLGEPGLFSAEAIANILNAESGMVELNYK